MLHLKTILFLFTALLLIAVLQFSCSDGDNRKLSVDSSLNESVWTGPPASEIPYYSRKDGPQIWYGHELIAHTATYLGPKGTVMQITNGMNCQNCHLDAGTKPWGNNYGAVYTTYPKFRERSGSVETIFKRVNDCVERSLNGKALDTSSKEMQAIYAYIKWLGEGLPKGLKSKGTGIEDLPYLERAADPLKGKIVFTQKCERCHGADGQGALTPEGNMYQYPPLWGPHSYTVGAGLYRLSRFAGYVKNNMPFETTYHSPVLTNEEAWDVAAFVNSQPRPAIDFSKDWPDVSKKPFDYPFGPFADSFTEQQHKFGPFTAIQDFRKKSKR